MTSKYVRALIVTMMISPAVQAERWEHPNWKEFEITKGHCVDSAFIAVDVLKQYELGVDRTTIMSSLLNPKLLESVSYRVGLPAITAILHDRFAGVNTTTSQEVFDMVFKPCKKSIGRKVKYAAR